MPFTPETQPQSYSFVVLAFLMVLVQMMGISAVRRAYFCISPTFPQCLSAESYKPTARNCHSPGIEWLADLVQLSRSQPYLPYTPYTM